ncbi:MAG TPA: LuxR C-terminal-related transcriptional regulator [Anaerolineaceae bacterium]|nr:LuxR C-terminal-related transcriptional regulator [Anaerolineaceae bacterium]
MDLLQARLIPPSVGSGVIARPQLVSTLQDAVQYPLVLLTAPAGCGKTTLLAEWARREGPAGWFSVGPEDNDPARFWAYWLAAVQRVLPDLDVLEGPIAGEMGLAFLQAALREISNRLAAVGRPVFLVLDHYHCIENAQIHQGLRSWIDQQPPNAHLVIATRSVPPLRLTALRARNQVREIHTEALQFSAEEIHEFFSLNEARDLSAPQIEQVRAATGGWAAGVRLAALALRSRTGDLFPNAGSGRQEITEYLADEVIERLPEPLQCFMTRVSVLEILRPELCSALSGNPDSPALLEQIEAANLFIHRVSGHEPAYQFQPFFREALLSRLDAAERQNLHRQAGVWLAKNGEPESALSQAAAGEEWEMAARLVLDLAETWLQRGEIHTLESWVRIFPDAVRRKQSGIQTLSAWVLYLTGRAADAFQVAAQLEREVAIMSPVTQGWWDGLRCQLALVQEQNLAALELAKQALGALGEDSPFFRGMLLNSLANAQQASGDSEGAFESLRAAVQANRRTGNLLGSVLAQAGLGIELNSQGKRNRAEAACREAIEALDEEGKSSSPLVGILHLLLAQLLWEANQIEAAEQSLTQGRQGVESLGIPGFQLTGLMVQAQILKAREDYPEALRVLNQARGLSRSAEYLGFRRLFEAQRVEIFLMTKNLAGVENWLEEVGLPAEVEEDPSRETEFLLRARYWIETGQPGPAQDALSRLESFARQAHHHRLLVQVLLARAIADWKQGEAGEMRRRLEEALSLAAPEGYLRLLLEDGAPVLGLLAQLPSAPPEIRALFRASGKTKVPELGETLTAREVDVIRLLAQNQTNAEIAQQLVVSNETVKAHLKHIFQKLEVADRREAVRRARELGLID